MAAIPPRLASAPGSTGKCSPVPASATVAVQLLAGHPGLDPGVEVCGVDLEDGVHAGEVDAEPAADCDHAPFHRGPLAEGDDGEALAPADFDQRRDLVIALREGEPPGGAAAGGGRRPSSGRREPLQRLTGVPRGGTEAQAGRG